MIDTTTDPVCSTAPAAQPQPIKPAWRPAVEPPNDHRDVLVSNRGDVGIGYYSPGEGAWIVGGY